MMRGIWEPERVSHRPTCVHWMVGIVGLALLASGCGTGADAPGVEAAAPTTQTTWPDDDCDQSLRVESLDPEVRSFDELLAEADAVVLVRVTGSRQETPESALPGEREGPQTHVEFELGQQWAGSTPVAGDFSMYVSKGAIRDHYSALLQPGTEAVLFLKRSGELGILSPGPVVVHGDTVRLGPCGVREAESRDAPSLLAIDGMTLTDLQSRVVETA